MAKRPARLTAKEIIAVLTKVGFVFSRQSGSHKIYRRGDGRRATVPFHGNKILHPKVLKNIIQDADIDVGRLNELL